MQKIQIFTLNKEIILAMAKKIVRLSEAEFMSMINEAIENVLIEMDGKTAMRVPNVSKTAKGSIQRGIYDKVINPSKAISNDRLIQKAQGMWTRVEDHWLSGFKGVTFKFFGEDRIGIVANILFTFEKLTKLSQDKTILVGTVSYNNQSISGDGIIINFDKGTVKYHEKGSRYQYSLEIDNRMRPQWDALLEQLRMALNARK